MRGPCTGSRRIAAAALVFGLLVAPSVAAARDLGRIEASLGGVEQRWQTITLDRSSGPRASAGIRFGPRLTEIQIQGYPGARFSSAGAISIDLRYLGPYTPKAAPMAVDILYMPEGMGGPFWTSNGATVAPTVRVLALEVWGGVGRIDLLFAGVLCRKETISAATDPGRCREVTGRVETELFAWHGRHPGARQ